MKTKHLPLLMLSALAGISITLSTQAAQSTLTTTPTQTDQPRTYQIELIVFSHITNESLHTEQWPTINPQPIRNDFSFNLSPKLLNDYLNTAHFYPLPESKLQLNNIAAKINRSNNYKVLLHYGWQQQFPGGIASQPIHLYGSDISDNTSNTQDSTATDQLTPYDNQSIWPVDGEVTIQLDRYFEVNLNLLFAIPTNQLPSDINANTPFASSYAYFHLIEKRRMRSRELNYIDSPLFSIIIKITPVKNPLINQAATQAQLSPAQHTSPIAAQK